MEHIELVVFGLLVAIAGLAVLAGVLRVPYPITLVLGGTVIGFLPGVPTVELDPDLVLLIFLPPLLYGAAFFTSVRELRQNARPIAALAIPLVFVTMAAVALVAHEVVGLGWAESFVLGAIVSPTDAVAPAEILRRVGAPRRLLAIVEGENLTNDWTALILYRVAIAAVVTGSFSLWEAGLEFIASGIGGLAVGLAAGWVIREVRSRIDDPPTEITISILSGYAGYLPAEELGFSGVIAAVTTGIYMAWYTPQLTTPVMRLQGVAIWEILTFLLNAVLFLLVGLQLPGILDNLSGRAAGDLLLWGALVSLVVIAVRLVWMFTIPVPVPLGRPARVPADEEDSRGSAARGWLGGHARFGVARGRARHPARDGCGRGLPRARPDHLPRLRGDPRDAGRPGTHARPADQLRWGSRTTARRAGRTRSRGGVSRRPRSRGSTSSASPTGSAPRPSAARATSSTTARGASARSRTAMATTTRTARTPGDG